MTITQELLKELFEYRDGKLFWKTSRKNQIKINTEAGCVSTSGYCDIRVNNKLYRAHRLIFLMLKGYLPKYIDHINRIKDDNRIENLRECTQSENLRNTKTYSNNTSGVKGVSWKKDKNKWQAFIYLEGKQKNLGHYDDLELAELVAQEARIKYHGDFANNG